MSKMKKISFTSIILIITISLQSIQRVESMKRNRNPFLTSLPSSSSTKINNHYKRNRHNYYSNDDDDDDDENQPAFTGSGREFNIFGDRGGDISFEGGGGATGSQRRSSSSSPYMSNTTSRRNPYYRSSKSKSKSSTSPTSSSSSSSSSILSSLKEWISNGNLPKIQCRVEPNTTLKVRKTFRPLKTIVRLGADFNTQLGVWQFKSSWEDDVIGGKLTLAGRELQFSKTWLLSVGT